MRVLRIVCIVIDYVWCDSSGWYMLCYVLCLLLCLFVVFVVVFCIVVFVGCV